MSKKINPLNNKEIDFMFDGHTEKPLSKMSPKEKIDFLLMQMMFKWQIRNKRIIPKEENSTSDENNK